MKVEWQQDDIRVGRIVGKPDRQEFWMIGYDPKAEAGDTANRYVLVSLADGMISTGPITRADMAKQLNQSGERPIEIIKDGYASLNALMGKSRGW